MAQTVKNPPAVQETWVRSWGQEHPLEKKMATGSSILAWRIPQTEEPGGLQSIGSQSWTRLSDLTLNLTYTDDQPSSVYSFSGTAVIRCHRLGVWKKQKFILLQV